MTARLLANGITFWPPEHVVGPVHILIEDGVISKVVDKSIEVEPDWEVFDLGGRLAVPGFVDAHTHLAQSFGRGIYDNLHLHEWLEAMVFNFDLSDEELHDAVMLSCLEALKSGTTCVSEMGSAKDVATQAIIDSGLRASVCIGVGDTQEGNIPSSMTSGQALEMTRKFYERWNGAAKGRIRVLVAPVGLPACSEELLRGSRALADELGAAIQTHCCEGPTETETAYDRFGCSEVEAWERFGVLAPDVALVHSVWLNDRDKEIVAAHGCSVVHCPSTNTKVTDGIPPMADLHRLGVNISLGCDGASSSGTYDMLQEARLASLLQKVWTMDASAFKAGDVYQMMTMGGAIAAGWGKELGALEQGRLADITVIEYPAPHLIDEQRLLSNLIFNATGGDVFAVFVGGRSLMWDRKLLHLNEEEVVAKILENMRRAKVSHEDYPSKRMNLPPAVTRENWGYISRHWLKRGYS